MITSKNYNSHRLPRSIGHCLWSLRRVSRNALPSLPLNPLKGTRLLCWSLGGASHLPGTDFSLDPSVVMETSLVMKNSLGLQPPSQTAFLWNDRELVKMKHHSAGEREEENDGNRFWETIFTLCFVCSW